jgi:hypothetical protein
MAYLMVKACKLESCPMKARGSAKFPILSPGKSHGVLVWWGNFGWNRLSRMKPVPGQEAELSGKVEILNSQLQGWSHFFGALYEPRY